jgi:hypothetical protein
MAMRRPNPVQWLRYAYGGRLPDRYRGWVLHDSTSRTWLLRFAAKIVVETLPWLIAGFLVLTLLTPLPITAVLGALILALLISLFFTVTSADELCEARLVKHGYPPGTGKAARRRRTGS